MTLRPGSAVGGLAITAGLAAALLLAGCASGPSSTPAPSASDAQASAKEAPSAPDPFYSAGPSGGMTSFGTGQAVVDQAIGLISEGSESSIARGITLAGRADSMGGPGSAAAVVVGDTLLRGLYPNSKAAGDGTGLSWKQVRIMSAWLADLAPALDLLDASVSVDEPALVAIEKKLAEADGIKPTSPLTPYFQGVARERRSAALTDVRKAYEAALSRSPAFWPAAAGLSRAVISSGSAAAELPLLQHLASLAPTPADRFEALARADLAAGQFALAADAAARGLIAVPDGPGAAARQASFAVMRATALERGGDWYQAQSILDSLLRLDPGNVDAQLARARLLHDKGGDDARALAAADEGEALHPDNAAFPELKARILLDQGKLDEAVVELKKSHARDPGNREVVLLLASTAAKDSAWDEADGWLEQVPDTARGPSELELAWRIYTGQGSFDKALASAQKLYRLTGDPQAVALQARSMTAASRPRDALVLIDHQLLTQKIAPELASELHYLRSQAGSEDPLRDLRSALSENPDNVEALAAISDTLASQKDYRKAMEYARRAAILSPGDAGLAQKAADLAKLAADNPS